jgi:3-oxoadipate enol-lactonase
MGNRKSYERGMKTRRKALGAEWVDRATATATPFNAEFQELITRYVWDEIWNRPGLTKKTRRTVVIAQTLALGRWEEFNLHVRAALESGDLTQDDVKEVLLQSTISARVPREPLSRGARGVTGGRNAGRGEEKAR